MNASRQRFLPVKWVDRLDKLNETSLRPNAAFCSFLKNTNITGQEYKYCQQVCEENNMQKFENFRVWYNNSGENGRLIYSKMVFQSPV